MLILLSLVMAVPLLACFWIGVFWQRRLLQRAGHNVQKHFGAAAILAAAPLLPVFLLMVAAATLVYYDGNCYGFTDGKAPCSQGQFALTQAFWAGMLLVPVGLAYAASLFLLFLAGWLGRPNQRS